MQEAEEWRLGPDNLSDASDRVVRLAGSAGRDSSEFTASESGDWAARPQVPCFSGKCASVQVGNGVFMVPNVRR